MKMNRLFLRANKNRKASGSGRARILGGSIALLASVLLPLQKAEALTYYWNTASGTWTTGANWSDDPNTGGITGVVPLSTDSVVFNQSSVNGAETISLTGATGILGMTFNNTGTTTLQSDSVTTRVLTLGTGGITVGATAGAVTIGNATNGTTITLGGTQTWTNNSTTNALTIVNALTLGANPLIIGGAGATTISGLIAGTVANGTTGLTIGTGAGSGTVVSLTNAGNTFTGDIAINGGKLVYSQGSATTVSQLGRGAAAAYKQILLTNGGTFQVSTVDYNVNTPTATNLSAGQVFNIGTGGGTFLVDSGRVFTLDDGTGAGTALTNTQLQGSGTLTKTGLGVLSLGNATVSNAVFTGQILVTQGVLRTASLTTGVAFGSTGANTVISSGAALDLGISTSTVAEPVTISGTGAGALALYNAAAGNGTNAIYSSGGTASSFAGPITLAAPSTIGAGAAGTMTLSGGVTGAHALTINNLNAGGTTFSTLAVNNGGLITNSGAGAGLTTISAVVGPLVTGIVQNSATSQLTLSNAANTFNTAITVTQGQFNASSVTGFGSATATTSVTLGNASTVGIANYTAGAAGSTRPFVVGGVAGGQLLNSGAALLTLTAAAPILNLAAGPLTIGGAGNITLTPAALAVPVTGGNTLTKIGAGTVTLNTSGTGTAATISGATPITITAGTLQQTSTQTALAANSLGTGLIRFNPVNADTATLGMSFASVTNTYSNTINIDAPATGASTSIISVSAGATFSGPIVLGTGAGLGVATLRLTNTNGAPFTVTATGGITGTGNISLNGTGATAPITISGSAINITGSITNIGTNAAAASVATISAPITTTNVTAISQQGASPFTISSSLALTGALNSFTSTGAGLWTFSGGFTGAQPLTFTTAAGGITISTAAINNGGNVAFNANGAGAFTVSANLTNTGTVTNSGTAGTGSTTISGTLGAGVTNVIQNSATSTLVMAGSNAAYAGNMTVTQGVMRFQTSAAAPVLGSQISVASGATFALNVDTGGWSDAQINSLVGGTAGFSSGSLLGLDTGASNVSVGANLTNINSQPVGLNKLGAGTLTLTGTNTYSGPTIITAGRLIAGGTSLSSNSNLNLFGTAVFIPTANFARPEGTAGGEMQISGGTAGFSSNVVGGLTVAFGTLATPTTVTWGNATFNPTALVLNDSSATTTINFSNPIDFNGVSRTVTVGSSTAATAATLSGVLSGAAGGLTKTGTGILNVTNTTNSYAGATTITTGTLSFNGGGSLSGTMALPSGTAVTVGGGTTFQVLNDTAGTLAYGNTVNLGGTQTITVGNNGGITTGSTVAFGQLNAPATALATATSTTFSSPNNYTTSFTGFALPGGTGNNTTLIANSNVIINGNVTNRGTGAPANFDTLFLQGTSTGSAINGVIADAPTGSITAGNYTPVNKSGTGTWTLTGANTYTGATTVSAGVLRLQDLTSATRATGFQVVGGSQVILNNPAGTLNVVGNVNIGSGLSTLQNTQGVVVAGGATGTNGNISLLDTTLNTLRIKGNAFAGVTTFLTLGTTVAAQPSGLSFDIGNADTDQIVVMPSAISGSGKLLLQLGGATISLNQLPSTSITAGTYDLITFAAGSTFTGAFSLASAAPAGLLYNLKLNNVTPALATAQQLEVLAGAGAGNVYWLGDLGTVWNTGLGTTATNFRSDYSGTIATALPTVSTNVFFTASTAAPANFASTTLGQGMGMNSLSFIGAAPTDVNPVGIGGTLPLTINATAGFSDQLAVAYAAGIGLVMQSGAAATTISAPVILGGNQTWQLDSANALTSSGAISGSASLTKTGIGTVILGGANTFSGGLTISGGTVIVNVSNATTVSGAAGPSTSTLTLGGAGNSVSLLANSFTVSNSVILGNVGANTATIGNNGGTTAAIFSGGVNLNGIDLTLTATGTTGTTTVSGLISGIGNLNYTPVVGTQVTVNQASYTGSATLNTPGTVNLNQTFVSNSFSLLSTGTVTVGGGGILKVKANGAGTAQSIITGNGVTGNNVVVSGTATLDVNNNGANAANAFVFNNLSINASQLNVTGANRYALNFAGTTTLTGAATLNPTTANLDLLGKVDDAGFALTVSGTGPTRLLNSATGGSANTFSSGTITVNGGNLVGYAPAAGAGTVGSNTLGTATIALTGTNPVVRLAPSLGATLTNGTTAGLLHKTVAGTGNPASVNWLGATTPATTGPIINLTGSQTVANLNFPNANGTNNVGHQFTGLLNITTPGMYNFSALHDDGVSLAIDGVLVLSAAGNTTTAGSVYLPAGLHAFSHRLGQGTGGVGLILSYQGPDTAGALTVVPASAFSSASSLADLNTSFANNFTVSTGTSATIDLAANTTIGTVTFGGTGATLNATGSNNITTLTTGAVTTNGTSTLAPSTAVMIVPGVTGLAGGTDTLVLGGSFLASTTFTAGNRITGVIADGASGGTLAVTKSGSAMFWTLSGSSSNTYTGVTTVLGNATGNVNGLILAKTGGAVAIPGNLTVGNGAATSMASVFMAGNNQFGATSAVTLTGINGSWAYLHLQGTVQTIAGIAETTPGFGVIETRESAGTFGLSNLIFNVASGTQTYQGYFRDIGAGTVDATNSLKLTKTGAGTLQWGAAAGTGAAGSGAAGHNYSGGTDIQNGTLQLLAANTASAISIVGAGNVSLNGGATFAGTLDLNNLNAGITGLDGTTGTVLGQVVNNGAATAILTVGNNGNSGSYAGRLLNNNNAGTGVLALTKTGAGTQTLAGPNAYSGLTTVNGGTLNITGTNTGGGAYTMSGTGILTINSSGTVAASVLTPAAGTTINLNGGILSLSGNVPNVGGGQLNFNGGTLKSAAAITIGTGLPIAILAGGGTFDTTGGNITMSSGISNTASPGTLNIIGGNTLQAAVNATQTGPVNITGAGTTFKTTAAVVYTSGLWTIGTGANYDLNNLAGVTFPGLAGGGTVLNTGASAARTVTITGAGGNTFSGSIQQPGVSSTLTTGVTVNLSSTSATQTFSGAHTYSGATTITQGRLALTGGSLDNTAISVAVNGTIAPVGAAGSFTAGNSTTGLLGASLNIASGGTLDMQDATIGTFTLTQNATFAPGPLTLASANLFFDINAAAGPDQIVVSGGLTVGAFTGTNTVNLTGLGTSLTAGTYPLITAPGITLGNTAFKFSNGLSTMSLPVGLLSYPLTLQGIAGIEQIVVGAGVGNFTWTGKQDGLAANADNSVWTATPALNNNFADASPAVQDYTDGSSVTFNDTNVITTPVPSNSTVTNSTVIIDAAGVNPGSVTVNNTAVNYTFSTSGSVGIAGAIGLDKTGAGTLTLSSVNTYSGATNINGGIVNIGIGTALGSGTIAFGGGTLQYGIGVATDLSSRFNTSAGELISIDTNGNTVTFATALTSATGTLTKSGAGQLTLTNTNTYTGATSISAGTLNLTGSLTGGGAISTSGTGILTQSVAGVISGASTFTQGSSGTSVLAVANTYTGTTTISSGILNANSTAALGNGSATNTLIFTGGTLQAGGTIASPATRTVTLTSTGLIDTNNNPVSIAGVMSGAGGLTKSGLGTLTLSSASSSFTGNIDITNGTLLTAAGNNLTNPTVSPLGNPQTVSRTITIGSNGTLSFGTASDTLGSGGSTPVVRIINNGGIINNTGNVFTTLGPVDLNGGTINAVGGVSATFGSFQFTGTVTVVGSAVSTLSASGANSQMGLKAVTGTTFDVADVTLSSASDLNVSAVLANVNSVAGLLTKTGVGTMTSSGVNTYTGATTVSQGTLTLSGARTVTATEGISVGNTTGVTGTLNITNGTFTVGKTAASNFLVGTGTGGIGILNQSGGSLTTIGNQLLIGNGTATGTYNLSAGTLTTIAGGLGVTIGTNTGSTGTFNLSGTGTLTMPATSTLQITRSDNSPASGVTGTFTQTGGNATVGILQMGGGGGVNNANANATLTLTGGIFSATTFNQLSVGNTSTSTITIGGTAQVTLPAYTGGAKGTSSTATITFDSTTGFLSPAVASAVYMPAGTYTNAFLTANGAKFNVPTGRDITIGQALADAVSPAAVGTLTKDGLGVLTLTGSNTYTGTTTVSLGKLVLNRTAANNTTIATDGNTATTSDILINGGTLEIALSEQIHNTGSINMTSGAFNFGAATGKTETIDKFTNSGGAFSTGANTLISLGATVTWSGGTNTVNNGGSVQDAHIVISGGTNTVEGGATGGVLQLNASGTGLEMSNGATLTLNSDNAVAGKLLLKGDVSTSGATTVTIASGLANTNKGTIDLDGVNTPGARTFTVADGAAASDMAISAVITNGALTKAGAGTMTVSADNTYTGATTVAASGGTLEVTGSLSGTSGVTVNSSGTLLLNNNVNNIVNTAATMDVAGGTLKIADGVDNKNQNFASLTLSGNSVLDFGGSANGTTMTFNVASGFTGNLAVWNWSGTTYDPLGTDSGSLGDGQDRLLFNTTTGFSVGQLANITFFSGAGSGQIGFGAAQVNFTAGSNFEIVPVPEPATTALIGAVALCALIGYRERRRFSRKSGSNSAA